MATGTEACTYGCTTPRWFKCVLDLNAPEVEKGRKGVRVDYGQKRSWRKGTTGRGPSACGQRVVGSRQRRTTPSQAQSLLHARSYFRRSIRNRETRKHGWRFFQHETSTPNPPAAIIRDEKPPVHTSPRQINKRMRAPPALLAPPQRPACVFPSLPLPTGDHTCF